MTQDDNVSKWLLAAGWACLIVSVVGGLLAMIVMAWMNLGTGGRLAMVAVYLVIATIAVVLKRSFDRSQRGPEPE